MYKGRRTKGQLRRVYHSTPESYTSRGNPRPDAHTLHGIPRPRDSQVRAFAARHDRTDAGTPAGEFTQHATHRHSLQASVSEFRPVDVVTPWTDTVHNLNLIQ